MDKVDVLAVLAERANVCAEVVKPKWAEVHAAVAELIEADEEHDAALAAVMEAEGYGHGRKQLPGAHPLVHALGKAVQRRSAALARVKAD